MCNIKTSPLEIINSSVYPEGYCEDQMNSVKDFLDFHKHSIFTGGNSGDKIGGDKEIFLY